MPADRIALPGLRGLALVGAAACLPRPESVPQREEAVDPFLPDCPYIRGCVVLNGEVVAATTPKSTLTYSWVDATQQQVQAEIVVKSHEICDGGTAADPFSPGAAPHDSEPRYICDNGRHRGESFFLDASLAPPPLSDLPTTWTVPAVFNECLRAEGNGDSDWNAAFLRWPTTATIHVREYDATLIEVGVHAISELTGGVEAGEYELRMSSKVTVCDYTGSTPYRSP